MVLDRGLGALYPRARRRLLVDISRSALWPRSDPGHARRLQGTALPLDLRTDPGTQAPPAAVLAKALWPHVPPDARAQTASPPPRPRPPQDRTRRIVDA